MVSNNWKENPNGESYTQRLAATGRPGLPGRLDTVHGPAAEEASRNAFRRNASEELGEHDAGGSGEDGGVVAVAGENSEENKAPLKRG
jgi:hypothetical protein